MGQRHETVGVRVGDRQIGGSAPILVQSMTSTPTADAAATTEQCLALAAAGSELVRLTVNTAEAARAVPEIRRRLDDAGCTVPLVGDFHYNGHLLLAEHPQCAATLAKYRVNPGNVGSGRRRDDNFALICRVARDHGAAIRIGVNGGSLDQELVTREMQANADQGGPRSAKEVLRECMVLSALASTEQALACGLGEDRLVISCKVSEPLELIAVYRELAARTRQPLHLGLTEAGIGVRGLVWSAASMGILLAEGIGDTVRVSLTQRPGGDRREEMWAACELLQALSLRSFFPSVTTCPGCGRTSSMTFQEVASRVEAAIRERIEGWRGRLPGVEELRLAVMGCVVNGPGESRAADVGISLPGAGEEPRCPVYVDGTLAATLQGDAAELAESFLAIVDRYVAERFAPRPKESAP